MIWAEILGETNKHGANMKNMASSWQCLAEAPRHLDAEASDLRPLLGIDLPDPWGVWLEAGDSGDGRGDRWPRWPVLKALSLGRRIKWLPSRQSSAYTGGTKIQTSGIWSHSRGSPCVNLAIENGVPPCIYRCMSHHLPSSPTMFPL